MWDEACTAICRRHPEVVAVFESPHGRLALLLRQTLLPPREERVHWLSATRRTARAITASLRAAGLDEDVTILQWRPLRQVARIVGHWDCIYEGDELRYAQLIASIGPRLIDRAPVATPVAGLGRWYRDMTPCWMTAEPHARRRLILRTHRWIAERVLDPLTQDEEPDLADLDADGVLTEMLARAISAQEREPWQPWIRLVLAGLRRALASPGARNATWLRWLFLIPYNIPVRGDHPPGNEGGRRLAELVSDRGV